MALPALAPVIPPLPHIMCDVGAGCRGLARGEQMALSPRRLAHVSPDHAVLGLDKGETTGRRGIWRCQRKPRSSRPYQNVMCVMRNVGAGCRGLARGEQMALSPRRLAHVSPATPF